MYCITLLNDAIYTANIYIDLPNHSLLGRDLGDHFAPPQALNLDQVIFRRCFSYLILNICRGRDPLIILTKISRAYCHKNIILEWVRISQQIVQIISSRMN